MTSLAQIIAISKETKSTKYAEFTEKHKLLQKTQLLGGISRTYTPLDEDGEQMPPEYTKVQVVVEDVIDDVVKILTRMFDVVATQDYANCHAKADVVVDGEVIVKDAPVTYLLFLEKQLVDLHTFARALPVLDASERWMAQPDAATNTWATEPFNSNRTKKVPRVLIKAAATEHHPAQVDVFTEDVTVGHWRTVKFSGALQASRAREIIERIEQLRIAVKFAREQANSATVTDQLVGDKILKFIFRK